MTMNQTIIEYLEDNRASFDEAPLNAVDSLVFSTIVYFNFECGALDRVVPSEIIPLPVAVCGISHEELYGSNWLSRMDGDMFLEALLASPRFMEAHVGFYANEVSTHFEKQFAAITFYLPDDSVYVAYRGTDNTLNGWKEDFNLTFMEEVPSQVRARAYLEGIADSNPSHLYVGGHSKGGNLAEYSALTCRSQSFEKIEQIFNHDGPGFAFSPSERIGSAEYTSKLKKLVPESSVFGMLMEDRDDYRVIQSSGVLFAQHAPTHWIVDGEDFVELGEISSEASILSKTLNKWASTYDSKRRELFIDAVYDIFRAAHVETWTEFMENGTNNALAVAIAVTSLPSDMRATIFEMFRDLAPILGNEAAEHLREKLPGKLGVDDSRVSY